ncbi:MAG: chloride channel protein [Bacteroidales bacterium]|nr:chloride channel protein [Bacteroidales bacterium]
MSSNFYRKLHRWRLRHLSEPVMVMLLAVAVGLLSGLAAVALKTIVHYAGTFVTRMATDPSFIIHHSSLIIIFLLPLIGIFLTVMFVRYIVRGDIGHGLPSVLLAISRNRSELPAKNMYSSLIASTITVAFGGSVGLEAPIASTGSAIGSNIGRWLRLSPKSVRLLLGCGAAGAIAGIFKAPFAGVLFVLEVFMFDLTATTALPLLIAALTASTVAYFTMGTEVQFKFTVEAPFALSQLPFYAVLGVFCAMVSLYFLRVTDHVEGWFAKRKSPWVKMLVGGLTLGVMVVLFPPLYGEGYAALTNLLHGNPDSLFAGTLYSQWAGNTWAIVIVLFVLILLKAIATATTIGSGGVGGTFGPSLVLGGLSGYFIATLGNQLGLPPQDTANFALVGMAAVMTGVMHAPFMATFLIADITGGYGLLVPLLTASAVTYLCISPFERHSIYARKLAEHGDLLTHDKDSSAWNLMNMQSLIETNFVIVRSGDRLRDLVEAIKTSRRNIFPVLSDDDKFLGVIVLDDVRNIIFNADLYDSVTVDDLMHPLSEGDLVRNSDSLTDVVEKFRIGNRYNLVVIDDQQNYLGFLSRANTFSAYRRFISATSDE